MQDKDFNFQFLEKLSEIKEVLATHVTDTKHLKIKVDTNEKKLNEMAVNQDNCKARKRSEGYLMLFKDATILVGAISAIIALLKAMGIA